MPTPPDSFQNLWQSVEAAYQPKRHRAILSDIWEGERWFDTPNQLAAAKALCEHLKAGGYDNARLEPYAADGKTRYQDWTTHLAWDCPAAKLWIAGSEQLLANREEFPTATVMGSGPLGKADAPVRGAVVCLDDIESPKRADIEGKYVLTSLPAKAAKERVRGMNPLAIVSDRALSGRGYDEESIQWVNGWGDGSYGWYFTADDTPMTGFVISHAKGRLLREALKANPSLELEGFCDARHYEGLGHCVTAVLEGTDPSKEIWLYGHGCEQGACDNCSGVAAIAEAMLMLRELVESGKLPRPKHSIRLIQTEECIGMLGFVTLHDDLRRKALVGLNVDLIGDPSSEQYPFHLMFGPYATPSIGWAVAGLFGEIAMGRHRGDYYVKPEYFTPSADDMIGDPGCGIPTMWLGHGKEAWAYHSSSDRPEVCVDVSLKINTQIAAAWAYTMATLDDDAARQIVKPACQWIDQHLIQPAGSTDTRRLAQWTAAGTMRDLARWGVDPGVYEKSASYFAGADAAPLDGLPSEGPRYARRTWGTCMGNNLPLERRKGNSPWSGVQNAAMYWTDGQRPLAAVERLVKAETGSLPEGGLAALCELLCESGVLEAERSATAV